MMKIRAKNKLRIASTMLLPLTVVGAAAVPFLKRTRKNFKKDAKRDINACRKEQKKLESQITDAAEGSEKKILAMKLAEKKAKAGALKVLHDNAKNFKNGRTCYRYMEKTYGVTEDVLRVTRKKFVKAAKRKEKLGDVRKDKHQRRMDDAGKDHALASELLSGVTKDNIGNLGDKINKLSSAIKSRDKIRKRIDRKEKKIGQKSQESSKLSDEKLKISLDKHNLRLADYKKDHEVSNQLLDHAVKNGKIDGLGKQFKELKGGIKERDTARRKHELMLRKKSGVFQERKNDCKRDYEQANAILAHTGKSRETENLKKSFLVLNKAVEFRSYFRGKAERSEEKFTRYKKLDEDIYKRKIEKHHRVQYDAKADCDIVNNMMKDAGGDPNRLENLPKKLKSFKKLSDSRNKIRDRLSSYERKSDQKPDRLNRLRSLQDDYNEAKGLFDAAAKSTEERQKLPGALKELNGKINHRESLLKKIEKKNSRIAKLSKKVGAGKPDLPHDVRKLTDTQARQEVLQKLLAESRKPGAKLEDLQKALSDYKKQSKEHRQLKKSLALGKKEKNLNEALEKSNGVEIASIKAQRRALDDSKNDYEASRQLMGNPDAKNLRKKLNTMMTLRNSIRSILKRNEKKQENASVKIEEINKKIEKNKEKLEKCQEKIKETNEKIGKNEEKLRKINEEIQKTEESIALNKAEGHPSKEQIKALEENLKTQKAEQKSYEKTGKKLKEKLETKMTKESFYEKKGKKFEGNLEKQKDKKDYYDKKIKVLEGKYADARDVAKNYDNPDGEKLKGLIDLPKMGGTKQIRKEAKVAANPLVAKESKGNKVFRKIFGARPIPPSVNIMVATGVSLPANYSDVARNQALTVFEGAGIKVTNRAGQPLNSYSLTHEKSTCEVKYDSSGKVNILFGNPKSAALTSAVIDSLVKHTLKESQRRILITIDADKAGPQIAKAMCQAGVDLGIKLNIIGNKDTAKELKAATKEYQREKNEREATRREAEATADLDADQEASRDKPKIKK